MASSVYHYIENYSNVGEIGISFSAISEMIKIAISDLDNFKMSKNVNCESKDGCLIVDIPIKINYQTNISEITTAIQLKVEMALKNMCEITNSRINVKVEGIIVKNSK